MATVTPTEVKIVRVADLGQEEVVSVAHDAARKGKVFFVAPTTGLATLAHADTLAGAGGAAGTGVLIGICSTDPRTNLAQESMTLLREADVWLGDGVLDDYDFGQPLFLSETTEGLIDDEAPAVANEAIVPLGYVVPAWRESGVDKLFRISTSWAAQPDAITVVPE